jgi:predicted ABC-type ATPase
MRLEQYINEGIMDKGILKAVFLAGNSGAGKSYVLSKIKVGSIEARIVNTDKIFEWQGNQNVAKAKMLTVSQLQLYVDSMLPLVIDGTSTDSSSTLKRKAILETLGYRSGMIFVNCSLETSLKRAKIRGEQMGRIVPPEIVTKAYEAMVKVKPIYKSAFEFIFEVNNDDGELTDELVMQGFRKSLGFFNGPLGPKGQDIVDKMKERGWKYLSEGIYDKAFIQQVCDNWYSIKGGHSI